MTHSEPYNPFYLALLLVSLLFVITILGVALIPVLEQKAFEAGEPPPPSAFRDYLRSDGWQLVLWEVGIIGILGMLSMGLDRLRRLRSERAAGIMAPPSQETAR